jgi:hypothetical protein
MLLDEHVVIQLLVAYSQMLQHFAGLMLNYFLKSTTGCNL